MGDPEMAKVGLAEIDTGITPVVLGVYVNVLGVAVPDQVRDDGVKVPLEAEGVIVPVYDVPLRETVNGALATFSVPDVGPLRVAVVDGCIELYVLGDPEIVRVGEALIDIDILPVVDGVNVNV